MSSHPQPVRSSVPPSHKCNQPSRREFLRQSIVASAAGALPTIISASSLGGEGQAAASERITLGVIGIGPRCTYDLKAMLGLPDVQCVAIADVQASRRDAGKQLVDDHYGNRDCRLYGDFRELLDRADIDAVLVATGDRWHAPASIMAARAGKHVYSEKPCGLTIQNCQDLADTMDSTKRVFQAGTQRRSVPNFRLAVEWARSGKLGNLQTLHASVYTPAIETAWLPGEPTPPKDICDWNLWLGTAPWRPYNSQYVAGRWRGQWDFDSGAKLLDWGAHTVDLCQWANGADNTMPIEYEPHPTKVVAHYANGVQLVIDFLQTPFGQRPGWVQRLGTCPVRFVGDQGSIETGDSGEIVVTPTARQTEVAGSDQRVVGLDVTAHARNFFDCIKSGGQTNANPQVMRNSHIACHAAALAWTLNRKLTIDPQSGKFLNDPEANSLRSRPERDPWAHA